MTGDAREEYRGLGYRDEAALKAWLAKRPREAALEPELPIIDPHHHFWDTPQRGRYLLAELLDDVNGGHKIVSTVFLECRSMYKKDGPPEMAPVGEVEFVSGIAAMSASGGYGPCRVAEGIVGHADLTLGARMREVLEAEIMRSTRGCRETSRTFRSRGTRTMPFVTARAPKRRGRYGAHCRIASRPASWCCILRRRRSSTARMRTAVATFRTSRSTFSGLRSERGKRWEGDVSPLRASCPPSVRRR